MVLVKSFICFALLSPAMAELDSLYFSPSHQSYLYPSAVAGKSFVPGLGHFALEKNQEGWMVIGLEVAAAGVTYIGYQNKDDELMSISLTTFQDVLLYSIYDSYIKTRKLSSNAGYESPLQEESAWDHLLAPLNLNFLMNWTTLVPLSIPLGLVLYSHFEEKGVVGNVRYKLATPTLISLNAAVGEEGFFRGFMFQEMEHRMGTPWAMVLSTAAFSAGHYRPGSSNLETGMTLAVTSGAAIYFNWLMRMNNYSLKENIFIHFWWDFIVIGYSSFTSNSFKYSKSVSWNF